MYSLRENRGEIIQRTQLIIQQQLLRSAQWSDSLPASQVEGKAVSSRDESGRINSTGSSFSGLRYGKREGDQDQEVRIYLMQYFSAILDGKKGKRNIKFDGSFFKITFNI